MLQPPGLCSHPCKGGAPWGDSGWERTGRWPQTGEVNTKGTVQGGANNDSMLDLLLWPLLVIALVRKPCPSAWMLNQSGFCQLTGRQSDPHHLSMAAENKKWTNTLLLCKINGLLTLLPHLLFSLFYKRTRHPDPNQLAILTHQSAIFSVCQVSK